MRMKSFISGILFKIIPIKKNRIVFTSFKGHYSDNPKYLSRKLHEMNEEMEQIWLINDSEKQLQLPSYIKCVKINSIEGFYYKSSAEIRIDNVYGEKETYLLDASMGARFVFKMNTFLKTKNRQYTYTTWHGTPLKRMSRDQIGYDVFDFSCPNTIMFLGNYYTAKIMKHLAFGKMDIKVLGSPRNDLLFLKDDHKKEHLKEKLGIPVGNKVILFAPTFRNDGVGTAKKNLLRSGIEQMEKLDISFLLEQLQFRFGGEWVFVLRLHYHVEAMLNWEELNHRFPGKVINGNVGDDMTEYLYITDVLLTDASSCMFDFALTKRPCFLFFPDLMHYQNEERGFYMDIESLPFPLSVSFENLINNVKEFNEVLYTNKIDEMLAGMGCADSEASSDKVIRYILERHSCIKPRCHVCK